MMNRDADKTVRDIRRSTRRKFSAEEKIRIVLEGLRGEETIAELCRKEGTDQNLYCWSSEEFLEAGKKRLAGDTALEATSDEVKVLRTEVAAGLTSGTASNSRIAAASFRRGPIERPSYFRSFSVRCRAAARPILFSTKASWHLSRSKCHRSSLVDLANSTALRREVPNAEWSTATRLLELNRAGIGKGPENFVPYC
jgi:transposase